LAKVAKQFEAVFIEMMLKQMRAATPGNEIFGSNGEDTYRSLFDRQMAVQMSRHESMGLAPMIEEQLRANAGFETDRVGKIPHDLEDYRSTAGSVPHQAETTPNNSANPAGGAATAVRYGGEKVGASGAVAATGHLPAGRDDSSVSNHKGLAEKGDKRPTWSTPQDFVNDIAPVAKRTAERLGVSPVALVAQAALETGWGKHVIHDGDGGSTNNLFNIKAQYSGWNGESVKVPTLEYREGEAQREMADFRAYNSIEESFADYADFLERNPRYREALNVGEDPQRFVKELQEAGYATDPHYASKLQQIMHLDPEQPEQGVGVRAGSEVLKISG
jgi:flagellar protein FlgJ